MNYVLRPGIVLEDVFGKYLLFADEKARKDCSYYLELNSDAAGIIKEVMEGKSMETMAAEFSEAYGEDIHTIQKSIETFLEEMHQKHYLVCVPEEQ